MDYNQMIENAATACQVDFDDVTREAIELNIIKPLTTLHAAQVAEVGRLRAALEESLALNVNWSSEAEPETLAYYSEYKAVIEQAREALKEKA